MKGKQKKKGNTEVATMVIEGIQLENGFFITGNLNRGGYNSHSDINKYKINGEFPVETHDRDWFYIKEIPSTVEKRVVGSYINKRFELIDPEMESDHIPKVLPYEEVIECCDNTWDCEWKKEYAHLNSLYEYKRDKEEDCWESIPYDFKILMGVDTAFREPVKFSYPVQKGTWKSDGFTTCTTRSIINQEIDKIMWPSVLLVDKPSKLSSESTYKIIRKHVQDNIDPKWAHIDSDYNFCFSVVKKIPEGDYRSTRKLQVFEMTHAAEKYKGYTVIKGFRGESHEDLKKNIDTFLEELMVKINRPMVDCPHCKGIGVVDSAEESK